VAVPDALTEADERALRGLAAGYATAVDRRDVEGFLAVFSPEAALLVYEPGVQAEPRSVLRGTGDLARVIERISVYDRTFHFVGQSSYRADGDGAVGEVYCTARHLTTTRHTATDFTMLIRYADRYERRAEGWRIVERGVLVDWTEVHTANRPADATPRRAGA
jgi:hypothetical protein